MRPVALYLSKNSVNVAITWLSGEALTLETIISTGKSPDTFKSLWSTYLR